MRLFSDTSDCQRVYDAVIVGSGLTGGWAAKELSESGLDVLILDAGPMLPPRAVDDLSWWNGKQRRIAARRQQTQSKHPTFWSANPQLFVDDVDNPYDTDTDFVWIRGRQVGGRSLLWGGVTLRFSDHEFLAPERDGFGARWPILYKDLEPYYDEVERFLHVQGSQESITSLPDGVFAASCGLTETEEQFKAAIETVWCNRRVIVSRGIPSPPIGAEPTLTAWSPRSSLGGTIPAAFATGRMTLRPDSVVSHLTSDPCDGLVRSVVCVDRITKRSFEVRGRVTLLCASTIESLRIMLNSRDSRHPGGIGNSTGLLGRYMLDHMAVTVNGVIPQSRHLPQYPLGATQAFCIPRFRNVLELEKSFIRGYGIWGGMQRGSVKGGGDGSPWFQTAILEVLPRESNRVELCPDTLDAWGIPVARIHLSHEFENERHMRSDAIRSMLEMSDAANLDVVSMQVLRPGQYVHELGGARMGENPATSVLNPFNQCWDAKNLLVLDGACFATAGWQNPSLTMMAIAVRACTNICRGLPLTKPCWTNTARTSPDNSALL